MASSCATALRELRLLLRDFFDAQDGDWGEEANAPRFAAIKECFEQNEEYREEMQELCLSMFWLLGFDSAIIQFLASQDDPDALLAEINEIPRRQPSLDRRGVPDRYVRAVERGRGER